MIKVDPLKVIASNLSEGETSEGVYLELTRLALSHMWRDRRGLFARLQAPPDMIESLEAKLSARTTYSLEVYEILPGLHAILRKDEDVWQRYSGVLRDHHIGYLGEISVHYFLNNDWRLVYKFNALSARGHQPDGLLNSFSYNVKTRTKNMWGLSVASDVPPCDDFYVLCHYYDNLVHLIGYASRLELLERGKSRKFNNYEIPLAHLHPIEFFTPADVFAGLKHHCVNVISEVLPPEQYPASQLSSKCAY